MRGTQDRASPKFKGLASLGLEIGISCDLLIPSPIGRDFGAIFQSFGSKTGLPHKNTDWKNLRRVLIILSVFSFRA